MPAAAAIAQTTSTARRLRAMWTAILAETSSPYTWEYSCPPSLRIGSIDPLVSHR